MSPEPAIAASGLGKCYKIYDRPSHRLTEWFSCGNLRLHHEHWAIREVDFTIDRGETFGIIGRNGAGKSTLLSLLAGILIPTEGALEVRGRIGAIFQLGSGLDMELSGRENILHFGQLAGISREQAQAQLEPVAAFADLGEFLSHPVKTYSAGMLLRLGFSLAIWEKPDVLIVDEVLAVGDFFFRQKCHKKIQELIAQGTTVVLVSHDYSEVSQFCRRALLLDQGKALFLGDARQTVTRYLMLEHQVESKSPAENPTIDMPHVNDSAWLWPEQSQQVDLSSCNWHGSPGANCSSLAICNNAMKQTRVFEQGGTAYFYVEMVAENQIIVPIISILITDSKGQLVHGISTYQRLTIPPPSLSPGERLQVRIDIQLALKYGEYSFDVGFGSIDGEIYSQRREIGFENLGAHTRILGRLSDGTVFTVVPRSDASTVQLTHHGIADLPGSIVARKRID